LLSVKVCLTLGCKSFSFIVIEGVVSVDPIAVPEGARLFDLDGSPVIWPKDGPPFWGGLDRVVSVNTANVFRNGTPISREDFDKLVLENESRA
jgi:hypothetical protein